MSRIGVGAGGWIPRGWRERLGGRDGGGRAVLVVGRWLTLVSSKNGFIGKEMGATREKLLCGGGAGRGMMNVGVRHLFHPSAVAAENVSLEKRQERAHSRDTKSQAVLSVIVQNL